MLNTQIKIIRTEKDSILNELQLLKSKDQGGVDPNELASLKKKLAKAESDLRDKTAQFAQVSSELDQMRTAMEELKRRASVSEDVTRDLGRPEGHQRQAHEGAREAQPNYCRQEW